MTAKPKGPLKHHPPRDGKPKPPESTHEEVLEYQKQQQKRPVKHEEQK